MKAIVSRLVSIEEMAGMDVLCADKTGTLDQERADARRTAADGRRRRATTCCAPRRSPRERDAPDAIDGAILAGLADADGLAGLQDRGRSSPFDPVSKRAEAEVEHDGKRFQRRQGRAAGDRRPLPAGRRGASAPSRRRSTRTPARASAPSAWRGRTKRETGRSSAWCRCSIRRATTAPPPSPPPRRWGSTSRW